MLTYLKGEPGPFNCLCYTEPALCVCIVRKFYSSFTQLFLRPQGFPMQVLVEVLAWKLGLCQRSYVLSHIYTSLRINFCKCLFKKKLKNWECGNILKLYSTKQNVFPQSFQTSHMPHFSTLVFLICFSLSECYFW